MPDSRWWTFEDAESDLGSLEAGPEDLGRMLLLQYALSFSDDWFTIPIELEVGTLLQIRSLVVTDAFGVRTRIKPFHEVDGAIGEWRMFTHSVTVPNGSVAVPPGDRLFLPPVLGASLQGRPVEEVHLLRDEMANLAWAVEHKVENVRGRACDRHERYLATRPAPATLAAAVPGDADLAYRLLDRGAGALDSARPCARTRYQGTAAAPRRDAAARRRGRPGAASGGRAPRAWARPATLRRGGASRGAHVSRSFQHARWVDGSSHLWMSRRKRPGRGEGWSGSASTSSRTRPSGRTTAESSRVTIREADPRRRMVRHTATPDTRRHRVRDYLAEFPGFGGLLDVKTLSRKPVDQVVGTASLKFRIVGRGGDLDLQGQVCCLERASSSPSSSVGDAPPPI